MVNVIAAMELLASVSGKEGGSQLIADAELAVPLVQQIMGGKTPDWMALAKAHKLKAYVKAGARTFDALGAAMDTQYGEEDLAELLASLHQA